MRERSVGILLVILLGWHVWEKVQTGLLPEMLWACHLATALVAAGLLLGRPTLAIVGGLFHLTCGLPGWILEVVTNGTTPSSTALHLITPAAGLGVAWRYGVPAWSAAAVAAFWVAAQLLGRLCDPALNVNLAWHPYGVLPAGFPAWGSHLLNLGLALAFAEVARRVIVRFRPEVSVG